jgi:hypothetical protein
MNKVLILGGYGNFGKRIAGALVTKNIPVIVTGRNASKAGKLAKTLGSIATEAAFDIHTALDQQLKILKPAVVINTCGPFQNADYAVAETCIANNVHYLDLADGRDFVVGINKLNQQAVAQNVSIISGASTVPGLSSAVLEHFKPQFLEFDSFKFGISPGQKAERGLATTRGIMTYVGKPLKPFSSITKRPHGWQDIYRQDYPGLGKRWMANCDIPDLDLLPKHYGIRKIQFSAGLELSILHLGTWALSWLVRLGIPLPLPRLASPLLTASNWFDIFGTADGGMHMIISGKDKAGNPLTKKWFIIAKDGHGPHLPTIPAILLAERLAKGENIPTGAMPCLGLVSLEDYLAELEELAVEVFEE